MQTKWLSLGINHSPQLCQRWNSTAHGMTLNAATGTPCPRPVHGAGPPRAPSAARASTALHSCRENPPPAITGCLKVKQTRATTFLGNHLACQVKGLCSAWALGGSLCLFLPSAYLQPQQAHTSLPTVYTWHGAKSRFAFMSREALTLSPLDYKHTYVKNTDFAENNLIICLSIILIMLNLIIFGFLLIEHFWNSCAY